jgi:predicted nucleic acid-binding Zn finger protein
MTSTLVARAARQVGGIVLADNDRYTNRVEIRSQSSSRLYIVAQNKKTREWSCSCPGWIFARGGIRSCKHLKAMMPLLAPVASRPALNA